MKFYDCAPAPSPRLVRMFIAEKGVDIPVQEVDLRGGEHRGDAFQAVNPSGTVPALETESGAVLTSTQGCWRYLEARFPEPPLLGTTPEEIGRIADLAWWIEQTGFLAFGEGLRNGSPGFQNRALAGPDDFAQIPELAERGMTRAALFLERFEERLGAGPYLVGERFTAADIMAFVTIAFMGWKKLELPESATNARAWYDRVSERPSAQR